MKAASTIRIANVYYMLAYAFEALRRGPYVKINPDEFVNAEDMFGWILGLGISRLIKQGLHREYEDVVEDAPVLRGKINFGGTMKHWLLRRPLLRVEHDEFSENNLFNQILKATASVLLKSGRLKLSKNLIKNLLPYFVSVSDVPPCDIRWNRLRYQRNNQQYRMLMNVCRFVLDEMMMSEKRGNMRAISLDISDDRLHDLYEAFVREYFARHFNLTTRTRRIRWDVDAGTDYTFLPAMQADIVLEKGNSTLIIDTKYYGSILSGRIGGKISSGHLYQILAYVKNYQANNCGAKVSGMLLYAKTMTDDFNGTTWDIGHHRIDVRTLNLDQKFSVIAGSLDMIVKDYFGNITKRS